MATSVIDIFVIFVLIAVCVFIIYLVWPKKRRYGHVEKTKKGHRHE